MSVKKEPNGRRWVQVQAEVPGTPQQVWDAIATGPGVSSWFVPTEIETDPQGRPTRVISHMGPGMDSVATPTVWDPPRRFAAESNDLGPGAPTFATEWIVEAKDGATCTVRVIHSLFSETDDWDNQLEGTESGWPGYFAVLRLYLQHFPGMPCQTVLLMGQCGGDLGEMWKELTSALGLGGATVGQSVKSPSGTPLLNGIVEGVAPHRILIRAVGPIPTILSLAVHACGGMNLVILSAYLYGADTTATDQLRDEWKRWLSQRVNFA